MQPQTFGVAKVGQKVCYPITFSQNVSKTNLPTTRQKVLNNQHHGGIQVIPRTITIYQTYSNLEITFQSEIREA